MKTMKTENIIPITEKKKLCLSFSGGRTSAFMTKWCLDNLGDEYEMIVVFANTGQEHEETLKFVDKCDKHFGFNVTWVECVTNPEHGKGVGFKIVDFETADRSGATFEAMISKHGIPNSNFPHCSRELKANTIRAFLRGIGWQDYFTAIGIRSDEPSRLNWERAKIDRLIYPLATLIRTTRFHINFWWSKQPFDLELKSYEGNCKWCWKKALRKLLTLATEAPEVFDFPKKMEEKYGGFIPESRIENQKDLELPIHFFRDNMSVEELFEEAKLPFTPAIDESKDLNMQRALWDDFLDSNYGCVESCEAF